MSIAENVAMIRAEMAAAAIAAGRDPKSIQLCAATKMNDADAVRQAIAAGVDCCGENRVQELTAKLAQNAYEGAPVHFIGHLQTNKVKFVVGTIPIIFEPTKITVAIPITNKLRLHNKSFLFFILFFLRQIQVCREHYSINSRKAKVEHGYKYRQLGSTFK